MRITFIIKTNYNKTKNLIYNYVDDSGGISKSAPVTLRMERHSPLPKSMDCAPIVLLGICMNSVLVGISFGGRQLSKLPPPSMTDYECIQLDA